MKYVAVTGLSSYGNIPKIVFHYFDNYLISMGEPTTSKNWTLFILNRHFKKIIDTKNKYKKINPDIKLFVDSGGFQIIAGYIKKYRIFEYIDSYHFLLKNFIKNIDYIFSLDIMNQAWDKETLIKFNDKSIKDSINLIKQIPEIKNKQLFVIQTKSIPIFNLWKNLMNKHNVFKYYEKFSFGGLVGLKKNTRAKFSHVIPFIFWLLQKTKNVKHIHLLGQSSRLMIFTTIFLENFLSKKYNLNIKFTIDSSELIRFAKIEQKLPILCKSEEDYRYLFELSDLKHALKNHSLFKEIKKNSEEYHKKINELNYGKIKNEDFVDFICQNISNFINFSHSILDKKSENDLKKMLDFKIEEIKNLHPIFEYGRLAQEIYNNFQLIKEFSQMLDNNDLVSIEKRCFEILSTYKN